MPRCRASVSRGLDRRGPEGLIRVGTQCPAVRIYAYARIERVENGGRTWGQSGDTVANHFTIASHPHGPVNRFIY